MTVNEPVALPLCSLTVVREIIKGREQGPFLEPSQEKLTRFLAAADPLGGGSQTGPLGVGLCTFMRFWAGGARTFRAGPVKPTTKSSIQRKRCSKADVVYGTTGMSQLAKGERRLSSSSKGRGDPH